MPAARLPADEIERLSSLCDLQILDTGEDPVFAALVRVAAGLFGVPYCAVSLVDADRQWFKARMGLEMAETPRALSFCAHAILAPDQVLCVPDATLDARFADNPLVTGEPGVRFYAGAPLLDDRGRALGALCVLDNTPHEPSPDQLASLRDIAAGVSAALRLHGAVRRLDREARLDRLTGLGNRRAFEEALCGPGDWPTALLLLNVDRFRVINNTFGHAAGDMVLAEIGRRLRLISRGSDRLFRVGSDTFAIVASHVATAEAGLALAQRVHAAFADTFVLEGQAVPLSASIGVALTSDDGATDTMLDRADRALYEAKHAGRAQTRVRTQAGAAGMAEFDGRMEDGGHAPGYLEMEARLRGELIPPGRETFTLQFQPLVDLERGAVMSLEALLRWRLPSGVAVPPDEFVTLAERSGLVGHLDKWVMNAACHQAAAWPGPWAVCVNVSAVSFGLIDVPGMVAQALADSGLPASRLVVEMTETALAMDAGRAQAAVRALRAMGVRVALDDFGTGHGSLATLREFPFNKLKIDRSLVMHVCEQPHHARMVGMVAELGCALGMEIVAEGIETMAQAQALLPLGVALAQGYFFARPAADAASAVRDAEAMAARMMASATKPPRPETRSKLRT